MQLKEAHATHAMIIISRIKTCKWGKPLPSQLEDMVDWESKTGEQAERGIEHLVQLESK